MTNGCRNKYGIFSRIRYRSLQLYLCITKHGFNWRLLLCHVDLRDIPASTCLGHAIGIVIRRGTIIGENCLIHQNVTIGQKNDEEVQIRIGNNVNIGAHAIIVGGVSIGDNSIIGAGAFVDKDIPPNSIVISKHELIIKSR